MSDAMTNREIEDVLTSIRRLVAQEGTRPTDAGRLVLTEDQRVSVAIPVAPDADPQAPDAHGSGPDGADSTARAGRRTSLAAQDMTLPEPDFGKLEATIAELEAAVSASGETWDSEAGSDEAPRPSNVTDLYGRLSFVHREKPAGNDAAGSEPGRVTDPDASADSASRVEQDAGVTADSEAETASVRDPATQAGAQDDSLQAATERAPEDESEPEDATPAADPAPASDLAPMAFASARPAPGGGAGAQAEIYGAGSGGAAFGYDDDAIEDAEPAEPAEDDTILDEAALRALVAQIVREELHGQLGERVTQQVRKLVRTEIAKALEDRDFL